MRLHQIKEHDKKRDFLLSQAQIYNLYHANKQKHGFRQMQGTISITKYETNYRPHCKILETGADIVDEPKFYPQHGDSYYALFFKDMEGIKYEIVFEEGRVLQ